MAGCWDCYCAICCGIMRDIYIRLSPPKRRDPDSHQKSDPASDAESEYEDGDECDGYDPTALRPGDVEWLLNCRALGRNPSTGRAFISGPGSYDVYGGMTCGEGDDPDSQGVEVEAMSCYFPYEMDGAIIPFHWDCARILALRLIGTDDPSLIDKQALFRVMDPLSENCHTSLDLEYTLNQEDDGVPTGQEWEHRVGEEYFVCSPLPSPEISSLVRTDLERGFTMPSINSALVGKVGSDVFSTLPQEIKDIILCELDYESLINLLRASWSTHYLFHENNGFWKKLIMDQMPWFFEVREFLESQNSKGVVSMKGLYLWAQNVTMPRRGLRRPYTVVANRRRIWHVCDQLAERYDAALWEPMYASSNLVRDSNPSTNTDALPNTQVQQQSIWVRIWNAVRGGQVQNEYDNPV